MKSRVPVRGPGQSSYRKNNIPDGRLRLFFALWPPVEAALKAGEFVLVRSTLSAAGPAYATLARFPLT